MDAPIDSDSQYYQVGYSLTHSEFEGLFMFQKSKIQMWANYVYSTF